MCDPSLFIYSKGLTLIYMLVYVDDIIITGNNSNYPQQIVTAFNSSFSLKDLGPLENFLGIEFKRQPNGDLLLTQDKYIRDLLIKTNMLEAKSVSSPMLATNKLTKQGSDKFEDQTLYRSVVCALQYATITRLDISFSVNKAC